MRNPAACHIRYHLIKDKDYDYRNRQEWMQSLQVHCQMIKISIEGTALHLS